MSLLRVGVASTIRLYKDPGATAPTTHIWSFNHGATVFAVASDKEGNSYVGGTRTGSVTHRKLNTEGSEVWSADHGAVVTDIAVDDDGNVYIVGGQVSGVAFRKYNSAGTEQWSKNLTVGFNRVEVADDGYIYVAGGTTGSVNVRRYQADGTLVSSWGLPGSSTIVQRALAVRDNFIYTGHNRVSSVTNRKYNMSGIQQWTKDHGGTVSGVAVDSAGNVWAGAGSLRKYNSAGTQQWQSPNHTIYDVAINSDGDSFIATDSGALVKFDSDGTETWSYATGSQCFAIDWSDGNINLDAPALALPIRLGLPTDALTSNPILLAPALALPFNLRLPLLIGDREDLVPGLALPMALRLPTIRLEHPRAHQFADVYALYLGGVLLPFSSITCRRDAGGLGLTATITSASAELLAAVAANESETLWVLRGPRFPDGTVQLDGLWSAPLESWSWRGGPLVGSITLQARAPTVIAAARPRSLRDVSYIGSDRGARQIRGRIDSYLAPGDVALLSGGQSLLVSEITYTVQPGQAVMEVRGV